MKRYKGLIVIRKPSWFFSNYTAHAIYPAIFIPSKLYEEFVTNSISTKTESVLEHEYTHITRQREMNPIKWSIKYLFSKDFRYEEELRAIESGMNVYKRKGELWDVDRTARFLSSWLYLWCVSYTKAREDLINMWDNKR